MSASEREATRDIAHPKGLGAHDAETKHTSDKMSASETANKTSPPLFFF